MNAPYFHFVRWWQRFDNPGWHGGLRGIVGRFGRGVYHLLWTHWCGYGWPFAWEMARGCWFGFKRRSHEETKT
jgi:hypothetical protein